MDTPIISDFEWWWLRNGALVKVDIMGDPRAYYGWLQAAYEAGFEDGKSKGLLVEDITYYD